MEKAIDDPTVQSLYYGPILLAAQADPVGDDLETGLLEVEFFRYLKLDGDLAAAMEATDRPLHFATQGLSLAPLYVADPASPPSPPATQPYHIYLRRREPRVVFGTADSGVPNVVGAEGVSFLDAVWEEAPFPDHQAFVATVERIAGTWSEAGAFTAARHNGIMRAAREAESDLRP
jgi:hypothetical protein